MTFEEDYCRNCKAERKKRVEWLQALLTKELEQKKKWLKEDNALYAPDFDIVKNEVEVIKDHKEKIDEVFPGESK